MAEEPAEMWSVEDLLNFVTQAEDYRIHTGQVANHAAKLNSYWDLLAQKVNEGGVPLPQALTEVEAAIVADNALGGRVVQESSPNLARNYFLAAYWLYRAAIRTADFTLMQEGVKLYNEGVDLLNEFGNEYENAARVQMAWDTAYTALDNHIADTPANEALLALSYSWADRLSNAATQRRDANFTNRHHVSGSDIVSQGAGDTVDDLGDTGSKTWDVIQGLLTGKRPKWMPTGQWLTLRISVYGIAGLYVVGKVAPIVQAFVPEKPRRRRRRRRLDDEDFE